MGFYPQVQFIAENINQVSQTMFFSATWPREVQQFSRELCKNKPVRLVIGDEGLCLNNSITQTTEYVMENNKRKKLLDLLRMLDSVTSKFIVFVKTKKSCDRICKILENSGYRAVAIHGDKAQAVRE